MQIDNILIVIEQKYRYLHWPMLTSFTSNRVLGLVMLSSNPLTFKASITFDINVYPSNLCDLEEKWENGM